MEQRGMQIVQMPSHVFALASLQILSQETETIQNGTIYTTKLISKTIVLLKLKFEKLSV